MNQVIKNNGSRVEFNLDKIKKAVEKANSGLDSPLQEDDINYIVNKALSKLQKINRDINTDEISDIVEEAIGKVNFAVAREYIEGRYRKRESREKSSIDARIQEVLDNNNEEVKQENSNKNPVILSVQRDYIAGEYSRYFANKYIIPKDLAKAHEEGLIHIHDQDYMAQKLYNCFHKNTKFYTSEGIKSFADCYDGQKIKVLTKDGEFSEATVRKYGKQKLYKVVLKSNKRYKEVICTQNHRWILSDGTVTTNLNIGDHLLGINKKDDINIFNLNYEDSNMFCLGFAIGDGCDVYNGVKVSLYGVKNQYLQIFKNAGYEEKYYNNAVTLYKKQISKQEFLTNKQWKYLNEYQKRLLFLGLYCADGNQGNRQRAISSSDKRIIELINDTSFCAGYYISSTNEIIHSTPYKENAYIKVINFITNQRYNFLWKVESIELYHSGSLYDCWCVEEPKTHSFILENGVITGNCCLVNLEDMLQNGTSISGIMIEKPKSFRNACNIASQISAVVASNQYGGQSISLAHLAPFVNVSRQKIKARLDSIKMSDSAKEELLNKELGEEVKQGLQTLQYQYTTLQTTNGQAPFITVFMYIDEAPKGQTRDDLVWLIKEMLQQRYDGIKDCYGTVINPTFPKLIYVLDKDNITENSEYYWLTELAAKCTSRRMVPDYISAKIMKELKGDVYTCMGCRSFLTPDRFSEVIGDPSGALTKKKHKYAGRFNQGVVTVNLADVGLSAKGDLEKFWQILDERCEMCHRVLRIRHERLKGTLSDVAPLLYQYGALARLKPGETIDKLLYDGYSTISLGYMGLYECVLSLLGESHTTDKGKKLGLKIMQFLNDKCSQWKKEENIDYSVYGTPAESLTYKFAKCLQKRFGIIKGISDHNYITNSYHVNVREEISAFDKLSIESEFQALSPGGAISYVELPDMQQNLEAIMQILKHIYNTIMYAEINLKLDTCQCGFEGKIPLVKDETGKLVFECPKCHNRDNEKMYVTRRTCGYLGSARAGWNQGRLQEIDERVEHVSLKEMEVKEVE